jgi:hypothetical protein
MPEFVARIHVFLSAAKTWMAGTSPATTMEMSNAIADRGEGCAPYSAACLTCRAPARHKGDSDIWVLGKLPMTGTIRVPAVSR